MIKDFEMYLEGKKEQEIIDGLLDKGIKNLTKDEKELLDRLSKGVELPPEPASDPDLGFNIDIGGNLVKQDDDDVNYLNNLLGTNIGSDTKVYGVMPSDPNEPFEPSDYKIPNDIPPARFKEGDKISFRRNGSEYDGQSGVFLGMRSDGKYSIRFEDGRRLAAFSKNVHPFGEKKESGTGWEEPKKDLKLQNDWPLYNPTGNKKFKEGDKIIYKNRNSKHDNKTGEFLGIRDDGKYSVKFDDGVKFASNKRNINHFNYHHQ